MAAPNRPELNQELNLIISQTVTVCENFLLQVVLCELHNGVVCFSSSTVTLKLFGSRGNPAWLARRLLTSFARRTACSLGLLVACLTSFARRTARVTPAQESVAPRTARVQGELCSSHRTGNLGSIAGSCGEGVQSL